MINHPFGKSYTWTETTKQQEILGIKSTIRGIIRLWKIDQVHLLRLVAEVYEEGKDRS